MTCKKLRCFYEFLVTIFNFYFCHRILFRIQVWPFSEHNHRFQTIFSNRGGGIFTISKNSTKLFSISTFAIEFYSEYEFELFWTIFKKFRVLFWIEVEKFSPFKKKSTNNLFCWFLLSCFTQDCILTWFEWWP